MKRFSLLFLLILPALLFGQPNAGPRLTALGMTGVVVQDIWSLQANPAGLAILKRPQVSGAFEEKFMNPELSSKSAVFAFPVKNDVFGLSLQSYGFSAYTEQQAGLAYARGFGKSVFAAIRFNYHQVKIAQYGSAHAYSVEAGLQFRATKNILIGAHIANPNQSAYDNETGATIPVIVEFGLAYRFTDKVTINTAAVKMLNTTTDARFGIEYYLVDWIALRGGLTANPFRHFAGFGLNYQSFTIDIAASSHPALGYSPQLALSYEF
jgi:hypothetical protein